MSAPSSQPTLALVMCVHDEAAFLRANLAWHEAVGVGRAYIYLDRCSDASESVARAFPWVEPIRRDRPEGTRFMREFQNACAADALDRARADGFDWLLHVDADELASGSAQPRSGPEPEMGLLDRLLAFRRRRSRAREARSRASLTAMLAGVAPETELVILPTREALPIRLDRDEAFWRNRYFQSGRAFVRKIHDPISGNRIKLDRFLGHDQGKSIVRTAADVEPFNPHTWTARREVRQADGSERLPLKTEERGCHYHYLFVTPEHWLKKYRQFDGLAMSWPSGEPLRFPKGSWRRVAAEWTVAEASEYLDRWVYFDEGEARRLAGDPAVPNVVAEHDVADVLDERLRHRP